MYIARKTFPIAVAALTIGCATALQTGPGASTSAAITAQDLSTRLYIFADDSMMGRQFGTEGHKGAQYARELELGGNSESRAGGSGGSGATPGRACLSRVACSGADVFVDGAPLAPGQRFRLPTPRAQVARFRSRTVQIICGGDLSDTATLIAPEQGGGRAGTLFFTVQLRHSSGIPTPSSRGTPVRGPSSRQTIRA